MSLKRLGKALRRKEEQSEEVASSLFSTAREEFSPLSIDLSRSEAQGKPGSLLSDHSDDALPGEVEITEGGWVCQVERFEKRVDSRGRIRYRHPRERRSSPLANQDLTDPEEPQMLGQHKAEKAFKQSIISYFSHTITDSKDLIDLDIYIEIKSPWILEVLRENASYDQKSLRDNKVTFYEPYQLLWHQYHALKTYSEDESNPRDYRTHIKVLLDFLGSCALPNVPELIALCNPENVIQSITYASSWFLFTPGSLVVEKYVNESYSTVSLILTVKPPTRKIDRKGQYVYGNIVLECQGVAYFGKGFEVRPRTLLIDSFEGAVSLSELDIVPLSLLEEYEEKRDRFISRGQKFWDLAGQHMKEFVDGSYANRSLVENERVMVDNAMYARHDNSDGNRRVLTRERYVASPNSSTRAIMSRYQSTPEEPPVSKTPTYSVSLPTQDEKPSENVLILCDYLVWGFSFRSKAWRKYHVDDLIDVDFNRKSFDRLVLREDYKTILKAMVAQHFTQGQNRFHDLVAGKGQGLNILLHGPPGVGKTLTAECIADLYERPLYSVTSGDIGTDPKVIEKKLHQIFDYAVSWNAVVLLDEADVFLAERNLENLSRNALVSVFLRNIEYFNGVFFLTTNRVGTIDEAFQSRLHITLGLDPLSVEDRRQIWYHFIKDLKHLSKDDRRVLARYARDDWCHKDFNGRQIRNTVKTALTLARQDGEEVQARHFQIVLDIGTRFAGYMQRLKKMDRERLAEAIGTRLDLTANTLQGPETPLVTHTSKRKPEGDLKRTENKDLDLDWD